MINIGLRTLMHVLVLCSVLAYATSKYLKQCNAIHSHEFDDCSDQKHEKEKYIDYNKNRVRNISETRSGKQEMCKGGGVCDRLFTIIRIRRQSFGSKTLVHISDMLQECCGECAKYYRVDVFTDLKDVNTTLVNSADIIFPMCARSPRVNTLFGYHYIPVYNIPSAYYFTLSKTRQQMAAAVVMGCLNTWPLIIICLLMALIAGFVVWLTERRKNKLDFPETFYKGLFEGFWWSVVTMTTVGYGDTTVKSPLGRVFAIFWILIGILICSIFTASVTTEIIEARSPANPDLARKKVGALKYRFHDATMIAQHKGIVHEVDFNNTIRGIIELIEQLQKKKIDGFLINRSTYYYFSRMINKDKHYIKYKSITRLIRMSQTEKNFIGESLVSGLLVRDREVYEYIKTYFESNWLQMQNCYSYNLNDKSKTFQTEVFSSVEGLFLPFLYGCIVILLVIICFGVIYEIRRKQAKQSSGSKLLHRGGKDEQVM